KAPEALQKRVCGVEEENRPEGLWRMLWQALSALKESGARRLGRGCEASGPRPTVLALRDNPSLKRFVFSEISDGQTERIDGDEIVRNIGLEQENEVRGIKRAS